MKKVQRRRKMSEVNENYLFLNHSCDPILVYKGHITFVAMCNINSGQELKFEWAIGTGETSLERLKDAAPLWRLQLQWDIDCTRLVKQGFKRKYGNYFCSLF